MLDQVIQHQADQEGYDLAHSTCVPLQGPQAVKRTHHELAALLMKRNELAASMAGGRGLPPMLRDASKYGCTKCFSVNVCAVTHKACSSTSAVTSLCPYCQIPMPGGSGKGRLVASNACLLRPANCIERIQFPD